MIKTMIGIITLSLSTIVYGLERESYYVEEFCHDTGIVEYILPDRTRIDCLTDEYAIEVDFGRKWAEGIGQALYYGHMTGKKPAVLLILKEGDERFIRRFNTATKGIDIKLIEYYVD